MPSPRPAYPLPQEPDWGLLDKRGWGGPSVVFVTEDQVNRKLIAFYTRTTNTITCKCKRTTKLMYIFSQLSWLHYSFSPVSHTGLLTTSPFLDMFPLSYSILENQSHLQEEGKHGTKITFVCVALVYRRHLAFCLSRKPFSRLWTSLALTQSLNFLS